MDNYFCGWYFKCQSEKQTLALIPALHITGGEKSASKQIICDTGTWNVPLSADGVQIKRTQPLALMGNSHFSPNGISLQVDSGTCHAFGSLQFGRPTPLRYDIMGPFTLVPFLECRHSVFSMWHRVRGEVCVNGVDYRFSDATGYIEGDRGRSFPKRYLWTQCIVPGGALMLSVAEIPLGPVRFTGIIGVVWLGGKEYRLATYLGARVSEHTDGRITIQQGGLSLSAVRLERNGQPLHAPQYGAMTRIIREAPACRAYYRFTCNGAPLLSFESERASFEYEYPQ